MDKLRFQAALTIIVLVGGFCVLMVSDNTEERSFVWAIMGGSVAYWLPSPTQ